MTLACFSCNIAQTLSNNSLKYFISIYSLPSNCCLKIYSISSLIGNSRDRSFYFKLSVFQIKGSLSINNVWVLNRENLSLVFVNNKGTDQPAHQCRLISTLPGAHIIPKLLFSVLPIKTSLRCLKEMSL